MSKYLEALAPLPPEYQQAILKLFTLLREELAETATRGDLRELRQVMVELAEAQKRTEEGLNQLRGTVAELAGAQKRTEEGLNQLRGTVAELAGAQKHAEEGLNELRGTVAELAEAQKRTEEGLNELRGIVAELAKDLRGLTAEHQRTREQLGGLSMTVGYRLEDEAYKALPKLLKQDHGLTVQGKLKRAWVEDASGRPLEVNIWGKGILNGRRYAIVGEAKSQLSVKRVDEFIRKKLKRLQLLHPNLFPVLVTYMISSPNVDDYARQKGIALYLRPIACFGSRRPG